VATQLIFGGPTAEYDRVRLASGWPDFRFFRAAKFPLMKRNTR
jgi:hypothetical protein